MKEKFNKLFPYGIDFDSANHGALMQNRYDELDENQIEYIENSTLNFADMYEMLEALKEDYPISHPVSIEIDQLLKRARCE
jgi:hypothetical protein